jgi:predicted nucleotidyltransferase
MVKKITSVGILSLYLNDYRRKYYLGEIADLLKKPHQTIKPYLESLVKGRILIKIKRKNIVEYGLNVSEKTSNLLVIAEKVRLMQRLEQDTLLDALHEKVSLYFNLNTFVVFGSAVDSIKKGSDIDLLVLGRKNCSNEFQAYWDVYNKKVHKVQISSFRDLSSTLAKEIYKKHLIFNNTELIIRYFLDMHEKIKLV